MEQGETHWTIPLSAAKRGYGCAKTIEGNRVTVLLRAIAASMLGKFKLPSPGLFFYVRSFRRLLQTFCTERECK